MSADLIIAGVQFGCACFMSAPMPAMCGLDIDVPDRKLKSWPPSSGDRRGQDVLPGRHDVGLQEVATAGQRRATRRETRDERRNRPWTCVAGAEARRRAGRGAVGLDRSAIGDRRCTVGTECRSAFSESSAGVHQDHADAAGLLDRAALVDAGVRAAIADHDLARDLGGVEDCVPARCRGEAQPDGGRVRAGSAASVDRMSGERRHGRAEADARVGSRHRPSVAVA